MAAIDPGAFTAFLFDRERPGGPSDVYLRHPPILDAAERLLKAVLRAHEAPRPTPLTAEARTRRRCARRRSRQRCCSFRYNVTKAVARGSPALALRRIDPDRAEWEFQGTRITAPQGRLLYRLFDPASFGSGDTGAAYRFFGIATASAFAATGLLVRAPSPADDAIVTQVDAVGRAMLVGEADGAVAAARAWANALAWCEWTIYAPSVDQIRSAITRAAQAYCFGLRAAGANSATDVRWCVPALEAHGAADRRVDAPIDVVALPPC